MGVFYARNRLSALKNLENASLTPNQPKNRIFAIFMIFWADLGPGKRFQDFSMRAIESSNRKTPYSYFRKKYWKVGRKIAKIHFFSHPVNVTLFTTNSLFINLLWTLVEKLMILNCIHQLSLAPYPYLGCMIFELLVQLENTG